jgi:Immunity protein Imm5
VTDGLGQAVADAHVALEANPDGHLPLPARRRIWAAWGFDEVGWRHTYALARLIALHVLPYWEARRPGDDRPREALALAESVAAGEVDRAEALLASARIANQLGEQFGEALDEPTYNAAMAARGTIREATGPDSPEILEEIDDDEDMDADTWGTDFYASMVEAPSLPKMQVAEHVEPRRAFWRWYLDEAVPAADAAA